jgi:hypothetical protein
MKTTSSAFAVMSVAAGLTTMMPATIAFGIGIGVTDASSTAAVHAVLAKQSYKLGQLVIGRVPLQRAHKSAAGISKSRTMARRLTVSLGDLFLLQHRSRCIR